MLPDRTNLLTDIVIDYLDHINYLFAKNRITLQQYTELTSKKFRYLEYIAEKQMNCCKENVKAKMC